MVNNPKHLVKHWDEPWASTYRVALDLPAGHLDVCRDSVTVWASNENQEKYFIHTRRRSKLISRRIHQTILLNIILFLKRQLVWLIMNLIRSVDEHTCRGNRGYFESGKETRIEAEESVKYFTCYSVACYRYLTLIIPLSLSSVSPFALACCVLFSSTSVIIF